MGRPAQANSRNRNTHAVALLARIARYVDHSRASVGRRLAGPRVAAIVRIVNAGATGYYDNNQSNRIAHVIPHSAQQPSISSRASPASIHHGGSQDRVLRQSSAS